MGEDGAKKYRDVTLTDGEHCLSGVATLLIGHAGKIRGSRRRRDPR